MVTSFMGHPLYRDDGETKKLFVMCLPGETAVLCSPENKLKNIDFTLRGYDIYKGNPLVATSDVSHTDPGLRRQIFDVDYNKLTPDRRYCIPDGLEVSVCDGCKFSWSTHVISGVKSYTDKLGLHVGVEGGTPNASFGASADYKKVDEQTSEHENVYHPISGREHTTKVNC